MNEPSTHAASSLDAYILENTPERTRRRYHALAAYAAAHDFGALDADVVVIDTETTGFSFVHDELIQIAAARMERGKITDWYLTFVNPGKEIPDDVAHLTNIHDEDVAQAPSPDDALAGLVKFVGHSDVVAHNVGFDRTFCTKRAAGEALKGNRWIDSLDLARIALPRFASHRLLDLARAFGVPESTHRADADVAATCLVYRILLAAVATMPRELVAEIASLSSVQEWNTVCVFQHFAQECGENDPAGVLNLRTTRRQAVARIALPARQDANKPVILEGGQDSEPTDLRELAFVPDSEVEAAFSPDGLVGALYADYEPREEQREMALAVHRALKRSRNLSVEAGTGVGKSMAYLVPLALAARENNITVGVATKTNTLLDQLVHKELPLLGEALGITYAPLKGFSHYLCLRKVEQLHTQGPTLVEYRNQTLNQVPSFAGLLSFIEQTDYDDFDALKIDYRAVPRWRVSTTSAECLRRKCPFFGRACFVHGAREEASRSDIVVTNHSLLFWDVRFGGGLLPPIRHWVIDEAHGAQAEARRALSQEVSSETMRRLARRVTDERPGVNVITRAQRNVQVGDAGKELFDRLAAKARAAAGAFDEASSEFVLGAKDLLFYDPKTRSKGYESFDLWLSAEIRSGSVFEAQRGRARAAYETLEKLIAAMRDLVAFGEDAEDTSAAQRELALVTLELRELYGALEACFFSDGKNSVYSVRMSRARTTYDEVFSVQPLDVGEALNESLYQDTRSVVYCSATLSVDGSFGPFERAMGLNATEASCADSLCVDSSFDFDSQMQVFVPTDLPEPSEPGYLAALQGLLIGLHRAQRGSMLTLFTNRREMESCFEAVAPALKQDDLRLVCQKWGVSVKGLRDDFLKDEHLSLFALKSFWEGFDAPGSTLRGVVIPKLPFGLPTDPLSCERSARDAHAWSRYALPAAVIDVKQAVGRLIRASTDRGIVVLADKRLISKYYGKKFLNSLPSKTISFLPCEDIVLQVRDSYGHRG